jgi:hypothetical protein
MNNEGWLHDTGLRCLYDREGIEYTEPVVMLSVVSPKPNGDGGINFESITTEDESDFLYEPVFFLAANWDRVEEELQPVLDTTTAVPCPNPLLLCGLCSSGIMTGETTGVLTFGIFERSRRDPIGGSFGCKFVPDTREHAVICSACLRTLNDEVFTLWDDGFCHDNECAEGTQTRCWRAGCAGGCEEEEEEE